MVDRRPDGRAGIHPRIVGGAQTLEHACHPVPFQIETDIGVRLVGDRCGRAESGGKPCGGAPPRSGIRGRLDKILVDAHPDDAVTTFGQRAACGRKAAKHLRRRCFDIAAAATAHGHRCQIGIGDLADPDPADHLVPRGIAAECRHCRQASHEAAPLPDR